MNVFADRFKGQVAIVTGGADGIGKAVARRLASEGGRVVLFDRNTEQMEKTQVEFAKDNLRVLTVKVEITNEESVKAGVERVMNAAKRLDILVNCAGIPGPTNTKITEYATKDFDHVVRVNLHGSFLSSKYALAPMLAAGYGRILLFASIAGKDGNPGMVGYSASKAGVIGMVKALGKEYAETGVTINGIAPAVIKTPLLDAVKPEQLAYMTDRIPMKRVGTPEEVAALAAWIVSKEATFNTGFTFDMSGGRAVY
jgi:3-oxoacyl-[acyl-carrier protein] reductase